MNILRFVLWTTLLYLSHAQTQTVVDGAGNSVVVVVTTNPAGATITQTISTLPPAGQATATTTTTPPVPPQAPTTAAGPAATTQTTTTTPAAAAAPPRPPERGPVGQPDPTTGTPGGPTPFVYTTVIDGVTTEVSDNFTPTDLRTTPFTPTGTGTVWSYSQWLNSFGGPQATANLRSAGSRVRAPDYLTRIGCLFAIYYVLL